MFLLVVAGAIAAVRHVTAPPPLVYETAEVVRRDIEVSIGATGKIEPRAYVDVGAQVSGQLRRLDVAIGQRVEEGQLVAEIDAEVQAALVEGIEADLARLEAELAEQEAGLAFAERQNDRRTRLAEASAASEVAAEQDRRDRDMLRARVDASRARIRQTEAQLRAEGATLRHARIVAPMSGIVVSLDAKEGQTLNANYDTPLILRIADLDTMTVRTEVSEADVVKLREGMPVWFTTLGEPERRWQARLATILPAPPRPAAEAEGAAAPVGGVVNFTALFDVENTGALRAGMTAQVFFVTDEARDVPVVPVAAIGPDGSVRVLGADGAVSERRVETGLSTRFLAEIRDGLAPGERVVTGEAPAGPPSKLQVEP